MNRPAVDLSIIIPAYMEADAIADTLTRLSEHLGQNDYGVVEVVVVVADSPDGTAQIVEQHTKIFRDLRVIHAGPRVGKGRDVRLGIFEATGRYRLFMDADLATPLEHIPEAYAHLQAGSKVVIATRDLLKIHKGITRKLMSGFGNLFGQVLILPGIKDTQCGFKAFEAEAAEAIFSRQTMLGWSFDFEILKIARLLGYQIDCLEAPDWTDPKVANMGLVGDSPARAAIQTLLDVVHIRLNAWSGTYKRPTYLHTSASN